MSVTFLTNEDKAVLEQSITQLSEEIANLNSMREYTLQKGTVDATSGGLGYVPNNRLCTNEMFATRYGDKLEQDSTDNNYQYTLFFYDVNKEYIRDISLIQWQAGNLTIANTGYARLSVRKQDNTDFTEEEIADVCKKLKIYAAKADSNAVFSVNGVHPDEYGNVDTNKITEHDYTLTPGTYWNTAGGLWSATTRAHTPKFEANRGTKIAFSGGAVYKYAIAFFDESNSGATLTDWLVASEYFMLKSGTYGINIMRIDGGDITDEDVTAVYGLLTISIHDADAAKADLINSLTVEFGRSDGASWQYVRVPCKTYEGRTVRPLVRLTSADGSLDGTKVSVPSYAKRENTGFVINAGLFNVQNNQPLGQTIIDGVSIVNEPHPQGANGETISETECYPLCIDSNGVLSAPYPKTVDTATMIADGIVQATSGWVKIVEDYEIAADEIATEIVHPGPYVQQIIGQFFDGDYCVLSVANKGYTGSDPNDNGLTYTQCAQLLVDKGVKFAYALDGGGSAQTVVGLRQINPRYDGRAAPSVIVFEAL